MTVFAYLRVSTDNKGQTTDNQRKLIADAGFAVNEFFSEDGVSGSKPAFMRPQFAEMTSRMKDGDTLIVTAVDRLGRSAHDILGVVEEFKARGIRLRVMQFDGIDITSPTGKMILTCMAAMAELERNMLIERTKAGMARSKEQGTKAGRPLKIAPADLREMAALRSSMSLSQLSEKFGYGVSTIDNSLRKYKDLDAYEVEYAQRQAQYSKED